MAENWVAQFGYGVIIAAGISFIPAMITAVSNCRKNSLDMRLGEKKDAREEAETEAKNAEREAKKLAADGGLENAREEGHVAALEQGRAVRGVLQEAAEHDRLAFESARRANQRWEDAEELIQSLEHRLAEAIQQKETAEVRAIGAQLEAGGDYLLRWPW